MIETESDQTQNLTSHSATPDLQITKLLQTESDTGESSDRNLVSEPNIDEPESDISEPEIHTSAIVDIMNPPLSLCVKLIITDSLPPGIISIK